MTSAVQQSYSYSGACHCQRHREISLKGPCDIHESRTALYEHNPRCLCECSSFVYENSHCSQKCQRQPNHQTASSGSHCSVSAMKPLKTMLQASNANRASTVFTLKILPCAVTLPSSHSQLSWAQRWSSLIFYR